MSIGTTPYTGRNSGMRGTGYRQITTPTVTPQQQNIFNELYGGAMPGIQQGLGNLSQLAGGGTPEFWQQFEAPAMEQFGSLLGNIGNRYSGAGARRSSGFNQDVSGQANTFAQQLQSNRMTMQQQAISDLLGLGQNLLNKDMFDTHFLQKRKPAWQELLGSIIGPLAGAGGQFGGMAALLKMFGNKSQGSTGMVT